MKKILHATLIMSAVLFCACTGNVNSVTVKMLPGEKWWGGTDDINNGRLEHPFTLPMDESTSLNLDFNMSTYGNQSVPFLVSSCGRYIWSDGPVAIKIEGGRISVSGEDPIEVWSEGKNVREAFLAASAKHFPGSGTIPPEEFLASPQYNTWIELMYNQNQEDILKYAHSIVDNGFPTGSVLMVDDNWQKHYGNFEFKPERFPDPKAMCDELHALGFRIMLWICPFVSPDSPEFRELRSKGYLVRDARGEEPAIVKWWNGYSAEYDLSNPEARAHLVARLKALQDNFGVDGFKLDAGDAETYRKGDVTVFDGKSYGPLQTRLWAELGLEFPYNEYRACWKMAGQPLVQRLHDKNYSWEGVAILLPCMIQSGLEGHLFTCPDMIGGGEFSTFLNVKPEEFDQDLIVRSCQIHAMMPMMQFSVAPWRILDSRHLAICRDASNLHVKLSPYILDMARKGSVSGEPIVRSMDYSFPGEGFEACTDQYMLGDLYMVAPMVGPGTAREVKFPGGVWVDENGVEYEGGKTCRIDVPIERIPYFQKMK